MLQKWGLRIVHTHIPLKNKKFLALLVILISSLALHSGCRGVIPPPIVNETIYRAYCVGVGDYMYFPDSYGNIDLPGPPYDVNRICYTLDRCRFRPSNTPFSEIWYTTDLSATKSPSCRELLIFSPKQIIMMYLIFISPVTESG